ncbi:hypothetical protein DICVIV_13644 [Dictyocaulus viviparus]|uniref:Uncharacterized protein n=1 Tax=Dictyocaulus viviparus TaxID=29172 RepID=A0A0D8X9U6_DICVI|nr:hypothetical protein DICVIV_13644 [Dictyocaulus viviparus]
MSILQYTIIIMLTVLLSYVQVFVLGNYTTSELFAPSSLYHLQIALATPLVLHYDEEIAQRLSFIVNDAVNAANAHHLRQPANFTNSFGHRGRSDGIEVKVG